MNWAHREVALKSIITTGDIKERQKQPHVIELAGTFKRYGGRPGNAMWVSKRAKGWELIAGRDRLAALLLIGAKHDDVREIVGATREELADLEEIENLYRRPIKDRDARIAARVARVAAEQPEGPSVTPVTEVGRPKSAKGMAIEKVAAAMQTTPSAIKQAVHRAEAREEGATGNRETAQAAPSPPPIEMFGHDLPWADRDVIEGTVKRLREAEKAATAAVVALMHLDGESWPFPAGDLARLLDGARQLGADIRASMPFALCPYCLGVSDGKAKHCGPCQERGWVTKAVFESAPAEKKLPPGVTIEEVAAGMDAAPRERKVPPIKAGATYTTDANGDVVPAALPSADRQATPRPAQAAKKKRGMSVVMPGATEARPVADVVAEIEAADDSAAWEE